MLCCWGAIMPPTDAAALVVWPWRGILHWYWDNWARNSSYGTKKANKSDLTLDMCSSAGRKKTRKRFVLNKHIALLLTLTRVFQLEYLPVRYPHQGGSTYWLHWRWWAWQAYWLLWREVWRPYCCQHLGWPNRWRTECRLGKWALRGRRWWRGECEGTPTLSADSEGRDRKAG